LFQAAQPLDSGIYQSFAPDGGRAGEGSDAINLALSGLARLNSGFRWSEEKIAVQFLGRTGNPEVPR